MGHWTAAARDRTLLRLPALAAWCAALSAGLAAPPAEAPRIEILQPRPDVPALDRLVVAFRTVGVPPGELLEATVEVDGRPFATLHEPPLVASGPVEIRAESHRVTVRVRLHDGRLLTATTRTAPLAIDEAIEVRLVDLAVSVVDRHGVPVTGLGREAFTVRDEGRVVDVERFSSGTRGLDVMLVLDASESMKGERIARARTAAARFVEALEDRDRIGLVAFHEEIDTIVPPTADRDRILGLIDGVRARGGTALYDALAASSLTLGRTKGGRRRIALVLSDGRDAARTRWRQASEHSLDEAIRAAHRADVIVYAVGLGASLEHERSIVGNESTADVLRRVARSTGGRFRHLEHVVDLDEAFARFLADARHLYSLAFRPRPARRGNEWRRIEVSVDRPGVLVRAREGYFAHPPGTDAPDPR